MGCLHRAGASGVLELVETRGVHQGRTHQLYLSRGLVSHVKSALAVPKLGELLQREGFLPSDVRSKFVRGLMSQRAARAGEVLTRDAGVPAAVVIAALRRQLKLKVDALHQLEDLQLRFRVALRPPEAPLVDIPLSPHEFLHGRARQRDRTAGAGPEARPQGVAGGRARALRVLGLEASATEHDVQRAFRRLAREFHPDRHPGASERERVELLQQFSALSAAYHQLCA